MSRKPTIKISYPEASSKALQLTEAMVKRAPGERVVRTESEDPVFPDGGELFSNFIRCKTQTGVDLTLTLNPSSMDYALETLIRPNLTTDERKQILGEEPETQDLIPLAQAAEAAGTGTCTNAVGSASRAADESATQNVEQETCLWMAAVLGVLLCLTSNSPKGKKSTWRQMAYIYLSEPEPTFPAGAIVSREEIELAFEVAEEISHEMNPTSPYFVNSEELLARVLEKINPKNDQQTKTDNPSREDVEADNTTDTTDTTNEAEAEQDGEFDSGLLNDIEDGEEGEK